MTPWCHECLSEAVGVELISRSLKSDKFFGMAEGSACHYLRPSVGLAKGG